MTSDVDSNGAMRRRSVALPSLSIRLCGKSRLEQDDSHFHGLSASRARSAFRPRRHRNSAILVPRCWPSIQRQAKVPRNVNRLSAATLFNRYLSGRMYFGLSLRLMQYAMKCFPPQVLATCLSFFCIRLLSPLVDSSFSAVVKLHLNRQKRQLALRNSHRSIRQPQPD